MSALRSLLCVLSLLVTACGSATPPAYPPANDVALEDTPLWDDIAGEDEAEEEEDDDWVDPGEDEDEVLEEASEAEPETKK